MESLLPTFASSFLSEFVNALTNGQPGKLLPVSALLALTSYIIFALGGRAWAFLYFVTIPFLNWSFGVIEPLCLILPESGEPGRVMYDACALPPHPVLPKGVTLHPLTIVTGLVFVLRDFVQRGIGQRVVVIMGLGIAWAFFYAWPVIAIASGLAFAVSEFADWALYTFTRYRLSTRILLSSAIAAPVDTTIFLYGADLAVQMVLDEVAGTMFHWANWIVFVIGKMVGAYVVSRAVRRREDIGLMDPASV